jgi:hypothetical protein
MKHEHVQMMAPRDDDPSGKGWHLGRRRLGGRLGYGGVVARIERGGDGQGAAAKEWEKWGAAAQGGGG